MGIFSGTNMKRVASSDIYDTLELGDVMYLMLPKDEPRRVIISCHGGHAVLSKTNSFVVPEDVALRFYSDDTFSVLDPGFSNFYVRFAAPKEIITEGDPCFDYILSKYQGRHGNKNETYQSIADTMKQQHRFAQGALQEAQTAKTEGGRNKALTEVARRKLPAVLTVRNRWFKSAVTLSLAVAAVKEAAPSIMLFDCLFCRSTMFGGSQGVELIKA